MNIDNCTVFVYAMCTSLRVLRHRAQSFRSKQSTLKSKLAKHVPASSAEYTLHHKLC